MNASTTRLRVLGEFPTPEAMLDAVHRLRRAGYVRMEAYTPFEIPGLRETLGHGRSLLPFFVFGSGLTGCVIAYWIQWYTNSWNYPLDVGNRPVHPVLAFIPATFEGTVLFAAFGAFIGLWLWLRLPKLWDPVFEIPDFERTTIDRFWISLERVTPGADAERGARLLQEAGALRVVHLERRP